MSGVGVGGSYSTGNEAMGSAHPQALVPILGPGPEPTAGGHDASGADNVTAQSEAILHLSKWGSQIPESWPIVS